MLKKEDGRALQLEPPAPLSCVDGALVPDRVRCAQEFESAVVRKNAIRPNGRRYKERIGPKLIGLQAGRYNGIDPARHQFQLSFLEIMLEPFHRPRSAAGRGQCFRRLIK